MKILVTGAAGFIGAHQAKFFSELGHDVVGLDSFSNYYSVDLKKLRVDSLLRPAGVEVRELNLADRDAVSDFFRKNSFDQVVHLAAQAGVRLTTVMNYKYTESNLIGFLNVFDYSRMSGVQNFLYASSSSVYGDSSSSPYSESELSLSPNSRYGATKLANEIFARTSIQNSTMNSRGLRFFTVYGPWGRPDMLYFRVISNLLESSGLTLFGDGKVKRDFTYIDDVTKLVNLLAEDLNGKPAGFSDIVNLGGGKPESVEKLIRTCEGILRKELFKETGPANPLDVMTTDSDSRYLQSLTGFKPEIAMEEGLNLVIKWASQKSVQPQLSGWVSSVT
jgi:UDP-glucuronate 4-epimerase